MNQKTFINWYFLRMVLFILGILVFLAIGIKISLFFIPFIIAFVVSMLIEPLVRLLENKARIPRKGASAISLLLVLCIFGYLLIILISALFSQIASISHVLPMYYAEVNNNINELITKGTDIYITLPREVTDNIKGLITSLATTLSGLLNKLVRGVFTTAVSIPEALVFTLVTILSTYFLLSDRNKIFNYLKSHLPDSWIGKITSIKNDLFSALFGYIRAQLIMMSITFCELFLGFSIIGIKYALLLAFVISIIDALPILGTGGVLIPWAIYEFLINDVKIGFSLLILYVIVLVVRQMIEPKILSQQIGLHPLVTLAAMYSGLRFFGVGGMILGPITVLVLKNVLAGVVKSNTVKDFLAKIRPPEDGL